MTDNEIVRALECCFGSEGLCPRQQCPFYEKCKNDESLAMYAHDLIIQLKAENTELQLSIFALQNEARKEFADRLKEKAYVDGAVSITQELVVDVRDIDDLVEEMAVNYESSKNDK